MFKGLLICLIALVIVGCDGVAKITNHLGPADFHEADTSVRCSHVDVTLSIQLPDLSANCVLYSSMSYVPRGAHITGISALYDRDLSHLGTPGRFRVELFESGLFSGAYENGPVTPMIGNPVDNTSVGRTTMSLIYDYAVVADVWPSIYLEANRGAHLIGATVSWEIPMESANPQNQIPEI